MVSEPGRFSVSEWELLDEVGGGVKPGGDSFAVSEGAAGLVTPPLTNRRVTKHGEAPEGEIKGYATTDGGTELNLTGEWRAPDFEELCAKLTRCKEETTEKGLGDIPMTLGGVDVLVKSKGTGGAIRYKFIITVAGVVFLIHSNAKKNIAPIRLHLTADALAYKDVRTVYKEAVAFLKRLGFKTAGNQISRIDLAATLAVSPKLFFSRMNGHMVRRSRGYDFHGIGKEIQTFTTGTNVQLCIYDKIEELRVKRDLFKAEQVLNHFDEEPEDLTRVEFRLKRDFLRHAGIESLDDLFSRYGDVVDFLTLDWFRILEEPPKKGHEAEQKISPLWERVREVFFTLSECHRSLDGLKLVKRCRNKTWPLIRQAVGCLKSACAISQGPGVSLFRAIEYMKNVIRGEAQSKEFIPDIERKAKEVFIARCKTSIDDDIGYFRDKETEPIEIDGVPKYRISYYGNNGELVAQRIVDQPKRAWKNGLGCSTTCAEVGRTRYFPLIRLTWRKNGWGNRPRWPKNITLARLRTRYPGTIDRERRKFSRILKFFF